MQKQRGFTLIELLVVIAIIAILAAILFPVFAQARSKARQSACMQGIKQFGTATMMYAQDYDEVLPVMFLYCRNEKRQPFACRQSTATEHVWFNQGYYWHELVLPYIKNKSALLCAEAGRASLTPECLPYGFNWFWLGNDFTGPGTVNHSVSIARPEAPAETILISDGRGRPAGRNETQCLSEGGVQYVYAHRVNPNSLGQPYLPSKRHFGGSNAVFLDSHAQYMRFEKLNDCNNYWDGRGAAGDCRKGAR